MSLSTLTPVWFTLPLEDTLYICQIISSTFGFWATWFNEHDVVLPTDLRGLPFNEMMSKIQFGLLHNNSYFSIFQAFVTDPQFFFRGIEYFIGIAPAIDYVLHLYTGENRRWFLEYYTNLINSQVHVQDLDYLAILYLVEHGETYFLRALNPNEFDLSEGGSPANSTADYLIPRLSEALGKLGSIEMYELVTIRFTLYYNGFYDYDRIVATYAYYYGNIDFAEEVSKIGGVKSGEDSAIVFRLVETGRVEDTSSTLLGNILFYHIAKNGLFSALDQIMKDINRSSSAFYHLAQMIAIAMNSNDRVFLDQLFKSSWFDPTRVWTGSIFPYEPILFADPKTWDLVVNAIAENIDQIPESMLMSTWMGNRFDSIIHLRSRFSDTDYPMSQLSGSNLIRDYQNLSS